MRKLNVIRERIRDLKRINALFIRVCSVGTRAQSSDANDYCRSKTPLMFSSFNELAIGWLTMFVIGSDLFVVSPLLPMIAANYAISPASAGLSVTVFSLTYMLSAPLFGYLADRIGRSRM